MVNGSRVYRAHERVSMASALSSTLCHLPMPDPSPSMLTVYPVRLPVNCETHCVSANRTHNLPIVSLTRYQLCYRDHLKVRIKVHEMFKYGKILPNSRMSLHCVSKKRPNFETV